MVEAGDAVALYRRLSDANTPIWLTGGWGIDALLGVQTRPHKDLDVILLVDDVHRLLEILANDGYVLKELWSENRWVEDSDRNQVPTGFVLHDSTGRELDAHAMRIDEKGNGVPCWAEAEDFFLSKQDLAAEGVIAGVVVCCISPEMQLRAHCGYSLPEVQKQDLVHLHEKFGIPKGEDLSQDLPPGRDT